MIKVKKLSDIRVGDLILTVDFLMTESLERVNAISSGKVCMSGVMDDTPIWETEKEILEEYFTALIVNR